MTLFAWVLALLLGAIVLSGVARALRVPYPSLLALAGAAFGFLPVAPPIHLDPELSLALFVAPVLLDTAFDTAPQDLRRNATTLVSLIVVAVLLTTVVVAFVGVRFGLPLPAAVALGAIVSPPDAAAAAAVLNQFKLPRRLLVILQGESLLNDGVALLIYRMAVAAVGANLTFASTVPLVLLAAVGSPIAGYVFAWLFMLTTARVTDAPSSVVLQFVSTFGVWILADRFSLSPILTTVVYAMVLARPRSDRMTARNRIASYAVWETAVFVLNVLAFLMMGLSARSIIERLSEADRERALAFGAVVLLTVIGVRIIYVLLHGELSELGRSRRHPEDTAARPTELKNGVLVSWCGMRGLVTLATAFALPEGFPARDLILLVAYCVVLGTLVIQGLTLRPLIARLRLPKEADIEREVSRARVAIMQAALDSLKGENSKAAEAVRDAYAAARDVAADSQRPQGASEHDRLRLRAIASQRERLSELRSTGAIGDEAFHRLQEEIDWAELDAAPAGYFQPLTTEPGGPISLTGDG
jgi:CPA1 family monovalent cation:H+ antiporter